MESGFSYVYILASLSHLTKRNSPAGTSASPAHLPRAAPCQGTGRGGHACRGLPKHCRPRRAGGLCLVERLGHASCGFLMPSCGAISPFSQFPRKSHAARQGIKDGRALAGRWGGRNWGRNSAAHAARNGLGPLAAAQDHSQKKAGFTRACSRSRAAAHIGACTDMRCGNLRKCPPLTRFAARPIMMDVREGYHPTAGRHHRGQMSGRSAGGLEGRP
jgi:hypothetical protein